MSGTPPPVDKKVLSDAFRGAQEDISNTLITALRELRDNKKSKKPEELTRLAVQLLSLNIMVEEFTGIDFINTLAKAADFAEGLGFTGLRSWVGKVATKPITDIPTGDRQKAVLGFLNSDFAKSQGVPMELVGGIWGIETRFSSSKLVSPTGCAGDFQFSKGTFGTMIKRHGKELAAQAEADPTLKASLSIGQEGSSDYVSPDAVINALKRGETSAGGQDLRYQPVVGSFSALKLIRTEANSLKISGVIPKDRYGEIFSAYNIGGGGISDLINAQKRGMGNSSIHTAGLKSSTITNLGHNPYFGGGNPTVNTVLDRYQKTVSQRGLDFHTNFDNDLRLTHTAKQGLSGDFDHKAVGEPQSGQQPQTTVETQVAELAVGTPEAAF